MVDSTGVDINRVNNTVVDNQSSGDKPLALISVFDKTNIERFARGLIELGFQILSSGGTASELQAAGMDVLSVSDYTGSPQVMSGRVKTLHPRVHGGILCRRSVQTDIEELASIGGRPIDLVVVNLYPFLQRVEEVNNSRAPGGESLIEDIDIGGPTMVRAAAKNCEDVLIVTDPADYTPVLDILAEQENAASVDIKFKRELAKKAFAHTASYDGEVARYFSLDERLNDSAGEKRLLAPIQGYCLEQEQLLRYGENPHQVGGFYRKLPTPSERTWKQLGGRELSYNNLLDFDGAAALLVELMTVGGNNATAVVIKHSNPCGASQRKSLLDAYTAARDCDPISAFGGIIGLSETVTAEVAEEIAKTFVEIVIAPEFDSEALAIFATKKNVRLIQLDIEGYRNYFNQNSLTIRSAVDGYLVQQVDHTLVEVDNRMVVVGEVGSSAVADLQFAWAVAKHTKSNAIVLAKELSAIGVGAGQMSRLDSARLAIERARMHGHDTVGAVAASDAFLPFADTLEVVAEGGVKALIQPGGSIRDEEVIKRAEELGVAMMFTGNRHFRH